MNNRKTEDFAMLEVRKYNKTQEREVDISPVLEKEETFYSISNSTISNTNKFTFKFIKELLFLLTYYGLKDCDIVYSILCTSSSAHYPNLKNHELYEIGRDLHTSSFNRAQSNLTAFEIITVIKGIIELGNNQFEYIKVSYGYYNTHNSSKKNKSRIYYIINKNLKIENNGTEFHLCNPEKNIINFFFDIIYHYGEILIYHENNNFCLELEKAGKKEKYEHLQTKLFRLDMRFIEREKLNLNELLKIRISSFLFCKIRIPHIYISVYYTYVELIKICLFDYISLCFFKDFKSHQDYITFHSPILSVKENDFTINTETRNLNFQQKFQKASEVYHDNLKLSNEILAL
ncbi:hypothetical protein EDEG_03691 [Edhazardia aedis USNM 41457]|uniref:Uncharacterized protein n=1 Tax=Edhazardia aedis (strain USNM 41457) TaxID=1003232 RepID=J9D1U7_EDHAE|nr:hypothetical protein EDEG_03691 [Edhazardia aedis USNM 41457]|eukprot:EJW01831.1 hypothetical protein EDEG_03691 [Edhazardia aedis USNM 41457]